MSDASAAAVEALRAPAPRRGPAIDRLVRTATRGLRGVLVAVLGFDLVVLITVAAVTHPDDRVAFTVAMTAVFAFFTAPLALWLSIAAGRFRRLFAAGELTTARVVNLSMFRIRGAPVQRVTIAVGEARGSFSFGGEQAGFAIGDELPVVVDARRRDRLFAALTPARGVHPGRLK